VPPHQRDPVAGGSVKTYSEYIFACSGWGDAIGDGQKAALSGMVVA